VPIHTVFGIGANKLAAIKAALPPEEQWPPRH